MSSDQLEQPGQIHQPTVENYGTDDDQNKLKSKPEEKKEGSPFDPKKVKERETSVKEGNSRCKVVCIIASVFALLVLMAAGGFVAYALITRPISLGLSRMKSFEKALFSSDKHDSTSNEDFAMNDYLR